MEAVFARFKVLSVNVPALTEKNHENSPDNCCTGWDTNWIFPECRSEALSIDSAALPDSGECSG